MISEVIYIEYISNLLEGNKSKCCAILSHLLEQNISIKELYKNLFQRSLYRVGKLWETNRICTCTEHNASSITEYLLNFIYPKLVALPRNNKKAVITCISKEFHQIGPRMVSDILELNGFETYFLGANTPCTQLYKIIDKRNPDLLGLSVSTYMNINRLFESINTIRNRYKDLEIIVGGQAIDTECEAILNKFSNLTYLPDLNSVEQFTTQKYSST